MLPWMPKESWECGTCSTVCSHRWCIFYQMVHLHVWMKVRSTNQARSQEHAGKTTWPDVRSVSCVRRGTDTTLSESQKRREESALLRTLPVFMFTPWPHRGGRRSRRLGPGTRGTLEFDSHLWGSGRAFHASATRILFEILFENSINGAEQGAATTTTEKTMGKKDKGCKFYHLNRVTFCHISFTQGEFDLILGM